MCFHDSGNSDRKHDKYNNAYAPAPQMRYKNSISNDHSSNVSYPSQNPAQKPPKKRKGHLFGITYGFSGWQADGGGGGFGGGGY
jgi:hypothetical protein